MNSSRMRSSAMFGLTMLVTTGMCRAQIPLSFMCTGEGQTKYVTGLGKGIVPHYDYSSRDAYVRSACIDEGRAVLENIHAYDALKTCAAIDIGLITAESSTILAKYEELAATPPVWPDEIGMLFCEKNTNSVTHQNYLDYYGDWWDSNYGKGRAAASPDSRDEALWVVLEDLAIRATRSAPDLLAAWPSVMSSESGDGPNLPRSRYGSGGTLSSDRWMGKGEIRTGSGAPERVGIAYFALHGRCLSLAAVRSRYPGSVLTGIPHSSLPEETTVWSVVGKWGALSFAFANRDPGCVDLISMDPHPALSPRENRP